VRKQQANRKNEVIFLSCRWSGLY